LSNAILEIAFLKPIKDHDNNHKDEKFSMENEMLDFFCLFYKKCLQVGVDLQN